MTLQTTRGAKLGEGLTLRIWWPMLSPCRICANGYYAIVFSDAADEYWDSLLTEVLQTDFDSGMTVKGMSHELLGCFCVFATRRSDS